MKLLLLIALAFSITACNETKSYNFLYPIEASNQDVLRIEGYRFLSSTLPSAASILVLSNPIKNAGFIDFAFAMTNNQKDSIHLSKKDFLIKISKLGTLKLLSNKEYTQAQIYIRPKGFDTLSPKMQAFGCSSTNTKDNRTKAQLNPPQVWVWDKHLKYPFKDQDLYLNDLEILAGETKGTIFRINLPKLPEDFEQATLLIRLDTQESEYRFKFILQSLK